MAIFPTSPTYRPVDPIFQGIVHGLMNKPERYLAGRIAPAKDVGDNATGTIMRIGDNSLFGDYNAKLKRAPGARHYRSPGVEFAAATSYVCEERSEEREVPDTKLKDSQLPVDLFRLEAMAASIDLRLELELGMGTLLGTSGNWATSDTLAGANVWSDPDADPYQNIEDRVEAVAKYGRKPNTIVFGHTAGKEFRRHPSVADLLPTTGRRHRVTPDLAAEMLASDFGFDPMRVFFWDTTYSSTGKGQTESMTYVADEWVWIGYVDDEGGAVDDQGEIAVNPTAIARFVQSISGDAAADAMGLDVDGPARLLADVREYDEPQTSSRVIQIRHKYDLRVISNKLGTYLGT